MGAKVVLVAAAETAALANPKLSVTFGGEHIC